MVEKYKNIIIDPTQHEYCFTLGELDCYKLKTGRCTFELSEQEYEEESSKCGHAHYFEGRVGYCRELLNMMIRDNAGTENTGIRGFRNSCGHISFSDGQHRSCIAKKNKMNALFFEYLGNNNSSLCGVCSAKEGDSNSKEKFTILNSFKKVKKKPYGEPIEILDQDL
ncbi:hypothetical protein MHH81_21235 [Psychrobacillus sp. FSL H8-0484]|uniref:hypothetical protein n=1 Tax=Psychrobacillus sp. FSL H8-0484 TaxID=2921390 RepID=UPI0030F9156A